MNSSTNSSSTPEQQSNLNSSPSHLTLFERMVQLFERESAIQKRRSNAEPETEDFMEYHNPTLSIRGYGRSSDETAT